MGPVETPPDIASFYDGNTLLLYPPLRSEIDAAERSKKLPDANCAKVSQPAFGVKRFTVRELLASSGCGIDHSEPHRLHFNVAILVTSGSDQHMVDFSPVGLGSRDLLLLRTGQVHAFGKVHTLQGEILTFTPEFVATLAQMPSVVELIEGIFDTGPRISLAQDSAAFVSKWYEEFAQELRQRGRPFFASRIACAFGLLLNRMATLEPFALRLEDQIPQAQLVRKFKPLLEANFLHQREPAWYANQLHVSTRTLDRQLVKAVRQTCKELIRSRLVLEAKRLLTDPDLQIKNVAYALGFDEVANFSRFFHQNVGVTPSGFRSEAPDWRC